MKKSKSDTADLHREIVDYLRKNPNAGDSLEGVMNWWLSQRNKKPGVAEIEQVLEQLIVEGSVRKVSLVGGTILYRKNKLD